MEEIGGQRSLADFAEVQVCLSCLDTDSKMLSMSEHKLEVAYEHLTGYPPLDLHSLNQTLCVECAQKLSNFKTFRDKSLRARALMMQLVKHHKVITREHIAVMTAQALEMLKTVEPNCQPVLGSAMSDIIFVKTEPSLDNAEIAAEVKSEDNADSLMQDELKSENLHFQSNQCGKEFEHEHEYMEHTCFNEVEIEIDLGPSHNKSSHNSDTVEHASTVKKNRRKKELLSCNLCSYKCKYNSDLVIHMRTHTGEKPFVCEHCTYKCRRHGDLLRHLRIHSSEKQYACQICSYKCSENTHLVRHMRIHTGEKPYECNLCPYKCTQNSNLVLHMRTHTGEKPFKCKLCPYECAVKTSLTYHERVHASERPFVCKFCFYKCTRNSLLVQHMRTHTGEKPFECQLCEYKGKQSSHLARHMRTHTDEGPSLVQHVNVVNKSSELTQ